MQTIGVSELAYFEEHGTEIVYEACGLSGFFAQVKKFFKDLDTNGVEYTISDAEPPQGETAAEADAEAEGEIEESFDYTLTQAGFLSRD